MRDVLNGGNGKSIKYRPDPKAMVEDNGFVYSENLYDPQIVMNQLKGEENNQLNQQKDQRIQMPEISSPLRDALLSQQAYSMAMQAGMDNNRAIRTTSAPAFATKTQVQANKYNHNCFFSPMNCRMWKQPLPVVDDASEIELGVHGGLTQEGPRAVMVRRTRPRNHPTRFALNLAFGGFSEDLK
uniref:Uncharacterized protein n=1 Tax=Ditylenchus dipsaci TaxID=166011 RepID=A0A915CS89_9BILA